MTAYALVSISCPHCRSHFIENARFVRPGGQAWCPDCKALFVLDTSNEAMRRTLFEAKAARRRRRQRLAELRSHWSDPVPAATPMLMGDVLRRLNGLLERIDELAQRNRARD